MEQLFDVRWVVLVLYLGIRQSGPKGVSATFDVINNTTLAWDNANKSCAMNGGGMLAILDTQEKREELMTKLPGGHYWVGLRKVDGQLQWVDGNQATSVTCKNIKPNKKCCTFKKKGGKKYDFQAMECSKPNMFVCQQKVSGSRPSSPTAAVASTSSSRPKLKNLDDFREYLKTLDVSDRSSMKDLLDEYDELMEDIDPDSLEEDDFNPLLEAQLIETFAMEYTMMHLGPNMTSMEIENDEIAYHAQVVHNATNSDVVISSDSEITISDFVSLPKSLFKDQEETFIVVVVFKNDSRRSNFTPTIFEGSNSVAKRVKLNTKIFSLNTFPMMKEPFQDNIIISLGHIQVNITTDPSSVHCSFWNFSIPSAHNGSWSERGCRVKSSTATHTVCECNHMTNFAVLVQLKDEKPMARKHIVALTAITYFGLILSLVGEVITVLCYCIFLKVSNEKIQIRINLLCALAAAQIVILVGINQTENKGICTFIAATIHFLYLVSFCWMLMEGVYLYRMVVKVFDADLKMRFSYIFSYGCPAIMVALALTIAEFSTGGICTYSNPKFCWVNFKNKLIWSFVAPVLLIVTINSVLLFCVIKEMFSMKTVKTISCFELTMIRASVRACVVLLPLLGITWVFGLLSLANIGIAWQYIFTILNATQGFMIFIFHCVRNSELRTAISLRFYQWESNHSNHSHGRVTPTRHLKKEAKSADDIHRDSIPMATGRGNKIIPSNTL